MKTVIIPVMRKAHHAQFLATPSSRTMPVTRFGVSAEKVQATMDIPSTIAGTVKEVLVKEGQKVSMEVTQGQKGPQAENVVAE